MDLTGILPATPSYEQACTILDDQPLSYWLPVLGFLQDKHQLGEGHWQRIKEGGNALFALSGADGNEVIVKLVPPNWSRQGRAEIAGAAVIPTGLSVAVPELIAGGELNEWVYVVMNRLSGRCLADVWPSLSREQKRPLMRHVGELMREFRQLPLPETSSLMVGDWQDYIKKLTNECMERHERCGVPEPLLSSVMDYIREAEALSPVDELHFIHMDIHPWNLMAEQVDGQWQITGLLDFGDAIFGQNCLFEINTPALFMAQGDRQLLAEMLDGYQWQSPTDLDGLRQAMMATALIRTASDITFVMKQVPETAPRDSWESIAHQLFPF